MSEDQNLKCFFVSDLHGKIDRFGKLFDAIKKEHPSVVFIGGDILPHAWSDEFGPEGFINGYLLKELEKLRNDLGKSYPKIFMILGNDDGRSDEATMIEATEKGTIDYIHEKITTCKGRMIFGYSFVPPTPFLLKDWEKYDVSRYVDPGCISPEEGTRSVPEKPDNLKFGTIKADLDRLSGDLELNDAIILFHSPPYQTDLDRAALDGIKVDHAPLDVNVGSIAIKRFIENKQPFLTMHGHIHESARITGSWKCHIGRTLAVSAAHDGPELALVRFDLENIEEISRELV
ncbi:MAG: metallophosphoesterase [Candidatus Krumholzibacteriota bacterium]|nr:metallophosphoesterase [Candidatus Krumholzibacteriota bacterium]